MPEPPSGGPIQLLAATRLEAWTASVARTGCSVATVGVGLKHPQLLMPDATVISFGLCGALAESVSTGAIAIPERVGLTDGRMFQCDQHLVERLRRACRRSQAHLVTADLLTSPHLITGDAADPWADRGFAVVDMETALLGSLGYRFAALRVVLDTPARPLDQSWLSPRSAALKPRLWPQLAWLAFTSIGQCRRAARILALGLSDS